DAFANALFRNPGGFGHHWIKLRLLGTRSNRSAIGARIRVDVTEDGTSRSIYRWVGSGGSFGGNPLRQEIGL
ncbi:MAG: CRTAC1 family protein, partial [Gemmatimonadetes bacterium]|nr:CRTAC1 family protein [Gemmatimonadota bacterium]